MKKLIFNSFQIIVVTALIGLLPQSLFAYRGGVTGLTQVGCGGCHGNASAATTASLEGPRTVRTGTTTNYTFVVAHNVLGFAGMNVGFRTGIAAAGVINAGNGTRVQDGQLTHNGAPLAVAGGSARFNFTWTAPGGHGVYTFNGAGNAVNDDRVDTDLDDWSVTGNIDVTVTGATFTAPVGGAAVCRGTPLVMNWTQTGLGNVRLEWSNNNFTTVQVINNTIAGNALTFTYNIPGTQEAGMYVIRMVDIASGFEIARSVAINVVGSPIINLQPDPTQVCEGKPLTLVVGATGADLQYRWRHNGVDIPGGINAILTLNTITLLQAGNYDCRIFGCGGNITSNVAVVTVAQKPRVIVQPVSKQVCDNDSVSFSIDAMGSDLSFEWRKNGEAIPGQTTKQLRIANVTLFDEGQYDCRVLGACTPEAVSELVELNVVERPLIRTQPVDRNLTAGDSLVLTPEVSGELLSFQWKKDGVDIQGATQRIFRKSSVVRADSGFYMCEIKNRCDSIATRRAQVRVQPKIGPGVLELTSATLELTNVASCAVIDTILSGLLVNEGGQPITITSISAEPVSVAAVIDLTAPLVIPSGASVNVHLRITPKQPGPISATVRFFASSGNKTFTVSGSSVTGLQFRRDTVVFMEGSAGDKRCNVTLPLACPRTTVTRIRHSGPGSGSYRNTSAATPFVVEQGSSVDVCFETVSESGGESTVSVETDAGVASFVMIRGVVSSVDDVNLSIPGMTVYPNPMTEELRITSLIDSPISVRIVSATGSTVAVLNGTHEVIWNRRSSNGNEVSAGLYVCVIEQLGSIRVEKVLVR